MHSQLSAARALSPSPYGDATHTVPADLHTLQDHLRVCNGTPRHIFALHCAAQSLHGFVSKRFVSSLVVLVLLIAIGFTAF
jgi:hypothetical protein